jgi:hypothetical protein
MKKKPHLGAKYLFYVFILCSLGKPMLCGASELNWDLKSECIGRAQLNLPWDSEVAAYPFRRMKELIEEPGGQQRFQFEDGKEAGWAELEFGAYGPIYISTPLANNQIAELQSLFLSEKIKTKEKFSRSYNVTERNASISSIATGRENVLAWKVDKYINTLIKLDHNLFFAEIGGTPDSEKNNEELIEFINTSKSRKIYAIPDEEGICIPYAFIKSDRNQRRSISASYRMKSHPDIIITFKDSGSNILRKKDDHTKDVKYELNDFWSQYQGPGDTTTVRSIWKIPSTHSITLAGRSGLASFVVAVRPDGTMDYGYLAIANSGVGEPKNTLQLLIIQTSAHAQAAGITPLDKENFLRLAEMIAKSIRPRLTKNP